MEERNEPGHPDEASKSDGAETGSQEPPQSKSAHSSRLGRGFAGVLLAGLTAPILYVVALNLRFLLGGDGSLPSGEINLGAFLGFTIVAVPIIAVLLVLLVIWFVMRK